MGAVKNGKTDESRYYVLRDSTTHAPKTDVTASDIDLYYITERAAISSKADASALGAADSAHADNSAFNCGQGHYRVDWPDIWNAGVGTKVQLIVVAPGCDTTFEEIELSPPVDAVAVGGSAQTGADVGSMVAKLLGTIAAGTHQPQSGDAFGRIGAAGASLTSIPNSAGVGTLLDRIASALTITGGKVTVGANDDKAGYALAVTPPTAGEIVTAIGLLAGVAQALATYQAAKVGDLPAAPDNAGITAAGQAAAAAALVAEAARVAAVAATSAASGIPAALAAAHGAGSWAAATSVAVPSLAWVVVAGSPSIKRALLGAPTGGSYTLRVIRGADGLVLDWDDRAFRVAGDCVLPDGPMDESLSSPGVYSAETNDAAWQAGAYTALASVAGGDVAAAATVRISGDLAAEGSAPGLVEYALTSVAALKAELHIEDGEVTEDALVVAAINEATDAIETATGRKLVKRAAAETVYLDTDDGEAGELWLPEWPVVAADVTELLDDASVEEPVTVASADFYVHLDRALVLKAGGDTTTFTEGVRSQRVTYRPGYVTPPADIVGVAKTRAARIYWRHKGAQAGIQSETINGQTVTIGADAFTASELAVIDKYKRLPARDEVKRRNQRVR